MNGSASKQPNPRGDSNLAAILTWFVPGAGHLYLGRPLTAILAFAVIEGLYFLGIRLSEGRGFEFLQPDLQHAFAGALTPEAGNLGALIWHTRQHLAHYRLTEPFRLGPWPDHIHLGAWLTAISGMLNVCLMVRAHMEARVPARWLRGLSPDVTVLLGWILPGLGQFLQGRRARGAVVFVLSCGLLALGTLLAQGSNLDRERHFYYWAGQFLSGAPAMALEIVHGYRRVVGDIPYADAGLVMVCLAGLLNVLALLDAYTFAEGRVLEQAESKSSARSGSRALA